MLSVVTIARSRNSRLPALSFGTLAGSPSPTCAACPCLDQGVSEAGVVSDI